MGNVETKQRKESQILSIDTSMLWPMAMKSIESQKELSGTIQTIITNNTITYVPKTTNSGMVDTVVLPEGDAWHTHPRECRTLNDCSLLPPSATDMKIFAIKQTTQFVLTRHHIYLVKLNEAYKNIDHEKVYDYFLTLEDVFDNVSKGSHSFYDSMWEDACGLCNWFAVYKFTNKDCINMDKAGIYEFKIDEYGDAQ